MDGKTYSSWDGATGDEELENILSILDFPMESLEADELVADWDASKSDCLGPIPSDDVLMGLPPVSHAKTELRSPVLIPAPAAPPMEAAEPKIPPYRSVAYPGPYIPRLNKCGEVHEQGVLQSQSPVSVLESSGSSSGKILLTKTNIAKQTRSKRVRPSVSTPWYLRSPFVAASPASRKTSVSSKSKERRRRLSRLPVAMERSSEKASDHVQAQGEHPAAVKKCTHCESAKTPQWREGPLGPKTLCNACGVRYRSGRLFPEYRPAASPTFMPWMHSNSHKRVIEMRSRAKEQVVKLDGIHSL